MPFGSGEGLRRGHDGLITCSKRFLPFGSGEGLRHLRQFHRRHGGGGSVSMPFGSGEGLRLNGASAPNLSGYRFYALWVGRGFATMPLAATDRCDSFYALWVGRGFATPRTTSCPSSDGSSFYALWVGRGFATCRLTINSSRTQFLCPLGRARVCDHVGVNDGGGLHGFYALWVGRGFATGRRFQAL